MSLKRKMLTLLLGIISCLVFLEIGLRLSGVMIVSIREYRNKRSLKESGAYRIVCLGESVTADGGSYAWPVQLEKVLNGRATGMRFRVINGGVEGCDSDFILSHLEENLKRYAPNMVIVMMGINDGGVMQYYKDIPEANSIIFKEIKAYRFLRTLWMHILNKTKINEPQGSQAMPIDNTKSFLAGPQDPYGAVSVTDLLETVRIYKSKKQFEDAEKTLKKAMEITPGEVTSYIYLGSYYIDAERYQEADLVLKKALTIAPRDPLLLITLARYYWQQERYGEAEEILKKTIEIYPTEKMAYSALAYCYRMEGKSAEMEALCKMVLGSDLKKDFSYGLAATLCRQLGKGRDAEEFYRQANLSRTKQYNPSTRDNYRKLEGMVKASGAQLVCMQYPLRSVESLKKLFDSGEGIIFVDNEKVFRGVLKLTQYAELFIDSFGGDFGHGTPRGNRLIAENVANIITKEVVKQ